MPCSGCVVARPYGKQGRSVDREMRGGYNTEMNSSKLYDFNKTESLVAQAHHRATGEELGPVRINLLIKHCAGLMSEVLTQWLKPYGLCYKSYLIMLMIYSRQETINPSEVCMGIGETRSNLTRLCDELVERNLACRLTSAQDRRRIDLSLTEEGQRLIEKILPDLRERNRKIYAHLGGDATQLLQNSLHSLMKTLEEARDA